MKIFLLICLTALIVGLIYFFYLGYKSQTGNVLGLVNEKLSPCSKKPNCICTEFPDDTEHFSDAISFSSISNDAIKKTILSMGGVIISNESHYLSATFTSGLFKYVDDFEVRIDNENKLIHVRSSSRVGHSDMGINLKRVEEFRQLLGDSAGL